ncbi:aspartate/glutamate racemase family protein [Cobetia sp. D5]|uniref:aspartate/glutamate racemase family protein n=1 Tax=Cobetia sp. D5 TaxID=3105867 RepID=UPI002D7998EC|nr:aspartate/glutamate racemase family protein [Cobetia sp. D5]
MRIVLVHAVNIAMAPIHSAFARQWPEAELVNLLDDALGRDRDNQDIPQQALDERIASLGRHALSCGADAVLYTCSAFGPAIEQVASQSRIPVYKPNEAMFEAALEYGDRIGMIGTFSPAMQSMHAEFEALSRARNRGASLEIRCLPEANQALREGDEVKHNHLICDALPSLAHCDVILLAHFSTATALDNARRDSACPVLSSPEAAVIALRRVLTQLGSESSARENSLEFPSLSNTH